jgi:hypothetical protein
MDSGCLRRKNRTFQPKVNPKENPMLASAIYQLKVTLKDSKPPIWRRILVPDSVSLYQLHNILQIVMGWGDYHLHQFLIGGEYYGNPEDDEMGETKNEKRFRLNQFVTGKGFKFLYEYDFGDSWEHVIQVEAVLPVEKGKQYPVCVEGKRACPPEDVGGIWGYEDFLQAISNPEHPEHEEMMEWYDEDFDPEFFDVEKVNLALRQFASRTRMK